MTIQNMHIAVKVELDKTSALELPSFEPEEIDYWLNNAIHKFVKTRYSGMNVKGTSFEQTQKRTDDLRTLVAFIALPLGLGVDGDGSGYGAYPNSRSFDIPADYYFSLHEDCLIYIDGPANTFEVGVTECTIDEYSQKINDPYSEHILHYGTAKPLRLIMDGRIDLINDGNYSTIILKLTYLKEPATVENVPAGTTDCDLPEHTHDEIVKLAVSMMLENIEQPRYQTYQNEVNSTE